MSLRHSLLTVACLLVAHSAFADVALVTSYSTKDDSGANATVTVTGVNCGAGNLCHFILVWRQNAGQTESTPTYGGSTAGITAISPTVPGGGATTGCDSGGCVKTWYACSLAGTQNVVFTVSAAANMYVAVDVFSGADCAGTPVGSAQQHDSLEAGVAGASVATAITTNAGGMGVDTLYVREDVLPSAAPSAGQTQRAIQSTSASITMANSTELSSNGMGWTWTGAWSYIHIATPINAGSGGGGGGGSGTVSYVGSFSGEDTTGSQTTLTLSGVNCGTGNFCKFNLVWRQNAAQTASTPTFGGSTTGITAITPTLSPGGASDGCVSGGCAKTWYACDRVGTQNVVFTMSAAANMFASVHVYSGVDCVGTPVGTSVQSDALAAGNQATITTTIVTNSGGMGSDVIYVRDDLANGTGMTPGSGQTLRQTQNDSGSIGMWSSDKASATGMTWTWTGGFAFTHIATPINAGTGGGGGGGGTCKGAILLLKVGGC